MTFKTAKELLDVEEIIEEKVELARLVLLKTLDLVPNIDSRLQVEIYRQVCEHLRAQKGKRKILSKNQKRLL